MNIKSIALTFVLTLFSGTSLAGSGHDHGHDHGHNHAHEPVTQQQAEQQASRVVSALINKGVIENSWTSVKVDKSEKKTFGGNQEWVVSYKNAAVSDPKKSTLYIFLNVAGEYIAANYTGQ